MGSGKTTVGKALAEELGLTFYDLDWCIESRYHRTIPELFAERGEAGFRELERRILHEYGEFEDVVIACGGGTPCFFDNMDFILQQSDCVYLKATPETLAMHLRMGKVERPLIKGKSPDELHQYICQSLEIREPYYNRAQHTLCVDLLENFSKIKITVQLIRNILNI